MKKVLEESCDRVPQIVKTYTVWENGHRSDDHQFFRDMAVEREDHRLLFETWFKMRPGTWIVGAFMKYQDFMSAHFAESLTMMVHKVLLEGFGRAGPLMQSLVQSWCSRT